jgi:hypothetical protein
MEDFASDVTMGDKYFPAMNIDDQKDADEYFEACVKHRMLVFDSREEAERIERKTIMDVAMRSHQNNETLARVRRLFKISDEDYNRWYG